MEKLSIVIPVYYNHENLFPLYEDIKEKVLKKLTCDYEIVMVDDGSKDDSYSVICELAKIDSKIVPVRLSRNFGEHAAILAGLSKCTGDCATMKAADLQEPSEIILDMLAKYKEGNKVVLAVRADRDEAWTRKIAATIYCFVMKKLALSDMPKGGFDCFLIDRQVIDILTFMQEKNTSLMGQILWSGFQSEKIYYTRQKRTIGKSKWTLSKKFKLFFDSLLGFSYFPLRFISTTGVVCSVGSLLWMLYTFIAKLTGHITLEGYTTLIMLQLLSFGIIMLSLGILGGYVWRMFDAVRNRPPYIIDTVKQGNKQYDETEVHETDEI